MVSSSPISASVILVLGTLLPHCVVVAEPSASSDFLRKVNIREVEADLQATLATLLDGTSASGTQRLARIEAKTWQSFQALPKNSAGRLAPPAVRHIVHGYFAREHGWLIKGLEPHGMQVNISEVHDVNVLQDKAPLLVEGLLQARHADRGLSFNDIVTMVAVLEQMMFDESVTLLEAAYRLNGLIMADKVNMEMLHTVMQSYLVLFGQGAKANLFDADRHQALRQSRKHEVDEFEHDTVLNYEFARRHHANPFRTSQYSFEDATEIMQDLAQQYGMWQNSECREMKAHLTELDPEGLGLVPLGLFYAQPAGPSYHFSESADYLRSIGALDETSPGNPKVYIANYVNGPSNCIASSSYYSVCCLSECEEIMAELEQHISAPTATPEKLLSVIRQISHTDLQHSLQDKLQAIAARHGGEIPLHGRLFAQWLHFAFPHECPYPSVVQSATALTAHEWHNGQSIASEQERKQHVESSSASATPSAEDFNLEGRWSDHEVLPVHAQPSRAFFQIGTGAVRTLVQCVAVIVALRSALAAWRGIASTGDIKAKKNDDCVGSLYV